MITKILKNFKTESIVFLVFLFSTLTGLAQQSTIGLYRPKKYVGAITNINIYLNNEFVTSIGNGEKISINLNSQGDLMIKCFEPISKTEIKTSLYVTPNSENYFQIGWEWDEIQLKKMNLSIGKSDFYNEKLFRKKNSEKTINEASNNPFCKSQKAMDMEIDTSTRFSKSFGTGFFINSHGIIATNYHVVEGANHFIVHFKRNGIQVSNDAELLKFDKINDIALLKLKNYNYAFDTIPYSISTDYKIAETVFTIGFPLVQLMGNEFKVSNGIINSISGLEDDYSKMQISTPIQPGNSGGPLFNEYGDIIGITTSTLNSNFVESYTGGNIPQNVNYAVKADYLLILSKEFINQTESKKNSEKIVFSEKVNEFGGFVCKVEAIF